eukprot:SAG11_NODE_1518_length_4761_cov_2.905405_2_plen_237_part_00
MADEWIHPDQLSEMKQKDLVKLAKRQGSGVDPDQLEAARDEDQAKEAVIALLVKAWEERQAKEEAKRQAETAAVAAAAAAAEAAAVAAALSVEGAGGRDGGHGGEGDDESSSGSDSSSAPYDDDEAEPSPEDSMASTGDMAVHPAIKQINEEVQTAVKRLYTEKIRPLEMLFQFDEMWALALRAMPIDGCSRTSCLTLDLTHQGPFSLVFISFSGIPCSGTILSPRRSSIPSHQCC